MESISVFICLSRFILKNSFRSRQLLLTSKRYNSTCFQISKVLLQKREMAIGVWLKTINYTSLVLSSSFICLISLNIEPKVLLQKSEMSIGVWLKQLLIHNNICCKICKEPRQVKHNNVYVPVPIHFEEFL